MGQIWENSHSSEIIIDLSENLNRDSYNLKQWLQGNKLSLNLINTQSMVVGSRLNLKKISDKKEQPPTGTDVENFMTVAHMAWLVTGRGQTREQENNTYQNQIMQEVLMQL